MSRLNHQYCPRGPGWPAFAEGSAAQAQRPPDGDGGPSGRPAGPHVGANGQRETPLTDGTATKVRDAALAKVSGTVERVETDVDFGSPYEAHIRKADGSEVSVLVNKDFQVIGAE